MKGLYFQLGFDGNHCVFESLDWALEEAKSILNNDEPFDKDAEAEISIKRVYFTDEEIKNMGDFNGW